MAGDLANGFVTVYEGPETVREGLFPAIERGVETSGHNDTPDDVQRTVHVHVSDADSEAEALEPCKPWRCTLLPVFFEEDVADPRYLQEHGNRVGEEYLKEAFVITDDPRDLIDVTETYVDCGFDEVVFQSSSPDQEQFCDVVRDGVMTSFA